MKHFKEIAFRTVHMISTASRVIQTTSEMDIGENKMNDMILQSIAIK